MDLSLESVKQITERFDAAGIVYASGGSGLLYSLGLSEAVRDWDLNTDASLESVTLALQGIDWTCSPSGDYPFASSYRLSTHDAQLPVDVIGRYAVHSENGICRLPALAVGRWHGLSMGSPEVWAAAYFLMKRDQKSELLFGYLKRHGADHRAIELLLAEPLPEPLRAKLCELAQ